MALLTLTVNNLSPALEKQHAESEVIHRALTLAMVDFRSNSGKKTSGTIVDAGVTLGSWTYTPQASS